LVDLKIKILVASWLLSFRLLKNVSELIEQFYPSRQAFSLIAAAVTALRQ